MSNNDDKKTDIQAFFTALSPYLDTTQQVNLLFDMKRNLPALQAQLAAVKPKKS